jgi:hypothetical protein
MQSREALGLEVSNEFDCPWHGWSFSRCRMSLLTPPASSLPEKFKCRRNGAQGLGLLNIEPYLHPNLELNGDGMKLALEILRRGNQILAPGRDPNKSIVATCCRRSKNYKRERSMKDEIKSGLKHAQTYETTERMRAPQLTHADVFSTPSRSA